MTKNIRPVCLALTLFAVPTTPTAEAGDDLIVRDRDGRRVETIEKGIGGRLVRRDPDGRRIGTIEEWVGDRLVLRERDGRRTATIEPGVGDRLNVRDRESGHVPTGLSRGSAVDW